MSERREPKEEYVIDLRPEIAGEEWRDIADWEGMYQISDLGRIRSVDRFVRGSHNNKCMRFGQILRPKLDKYGYPHIGLYKKSTGSFRTIHRLVALAFVPNPENKITVNHKNGIKTDNRRVNLEWNTPKENIQHAVRTGLKTTNHQRGELCNFSKLLPEQVLSIKKEYNKKTMNQRALALKYGVTDGLISMILKEQIWKHLIDN